MELFKRNHGSETQRTYTNYAGEEVTVVQQASDAMLAGRIKSIDQHDKNFTVRLEEEMDPDIGVPVEGQVINFNNDNYNQNGDNFAKLKAKVGSVIMVKARKLASDDGTVKYFGSRATYPGGKPFEYRDSAEGEGVFTLLGYAVPNKDGSALSMHVSGAWDNVTKTSYDYWVTINCPNGIPMELLPAEGSKSTLAAITVAHKDFVAVMDGTKIKSVNAVLGGFRVIPRLKAVPAPAV